jgi:hypothetical protein
MASARENPLRKLPDAFLACRDLRHAWEPLGYFRERGSGRGGGPIIRKLRCLRCGTLRRDVLSNSFTEKTTHYYGHPEGYRMEGAGRAAMNDVRQEVVKRQRVVTVTADELQAEFEPD